MLKRYVTRPRMYTATGSFNEVYSFLEGYGAGANVGERSYRSVFTHLWKWVNTER